MVCSQMLEEERGDVANPLVRRNTTSTTLMEELKELEEQYALLVALLTGQRLAA